MKDELRIKLKFDKDTNELVVVEKDLNQLSGVISDAEKRAKRFTNRLFSIGGAVGGIYAVARAFDAIMENGIRYNASLETMQIGIASLISVNTEAAAGVDKFSLAMQASTDVMQMLKKANRETSATLKELTEGFQSTLGPAMKAGLSLKETVEYTKLMTQAAGAMGVPMSQLAQEMRSVISGTIDMNSVVAKNIGITNEQIKLHKKQGDLFEFLKEKLGDFAAAGKAVEESWDGSVSNMADAWDGLTGTVTESVFESLKPAIHDLTGWINDLTKSFEDAAAASKSVFALEADREIIAKYEDLIEQYNEVQDKLKNGVGIFDSMFGTGNTEAELKQREKYLEQQIRLLGQSANAVRIEEDAHKNTLKIVKQQSEESEKLTEIEKKRAREAEMAAREYLSAYDKYANMVLDKEELFYKKLGDDIVSIAALGTDAQFKYYEAAIKKRMEQMHGAAEETVVVVDKMSQDIYKSFDNNFFDAITGRFNSFKSFINSLFRDILNSIINPFSRQMSGSIAKGLAGVMGFGGTAATAESLTSAGWKALGSGVYQNGLGQKVVASGGQIVGAYDATGSPIDDISRVSSLSFSASNAGTLSGVLYGPSMGVAQLGTYMEGVPYVGSYLSQGAYGASTALAGGNPAIYGMSGQFGAAGVAAGLGYLGGKTLDKLFGADTHAGTGGAIGAGIGMMVGGPIGAIVGGVLGSAVGGIFGKKKQIGAGFQFIGDTSAANMNVVGYKDFKKKGWFSSKEWSETFSLSESEKKQIKAVFSAYDYIFDAMGEFDKSVSLKAGKYSGKSFTDALAKSFFAQLVEPDRVDAIYKEWKEYAKQAGSTISEAISSAFNDYISSTRSFDVWLKEFRGDSIGALEAQAQYAQTDVAAVEEMLGVQNVTIDNYLESYRAAMKASPTKDVIDQWIALGEALKNSAELTKKLTEAQKRLEDAQRRKMDEVLKLNRANAWRISHDYMQLSYMTASRESEAKKRVRDRAEESARVQMGMLQRLEKMVHRLDDIFLRGVKITEMPA